MPKFLRKSAKLSKRMALRKRFGRGRPVLKRPSKSIVRIPMRLIPDKMLVKLPYTDLMSLIPSGSGPNVQKLYNINGLYDPETGALNQQNLGFSEYMNLYGKYRVYKVTYAVTIYNTSSQSAVAGSISFSEAGQATLLTDEQQLQLPYSRRFTLAPNGNTGSMKTIKGAIFLPRVVGKTSEQFRTNDTYIGSKTSNPQAIIQMAINCLNVNITQTASLQVDTRYTCFVELLDRTNVLSTAAPIEEV